MSRSDFGRLPPLHALAAFEAVARLRSFSRAANELCVTHSAVSHRIKLLEEHFAVQLFIRQGRRVEPTAKGAYLLGAVLTALSTLQKASSELLVKKKIVRVSVGPSFARYWLVGMLSDFCRRHPDIDVEVSATKLATRDKLDALRSGEADIAVRYGTKAHWEGFRSVALMEARLIPVCSPSYSKRAGGLRRPTDIIGATLLRLPHEPWKPWFEAAGLSQDDPVRDGPLFSDAALLLDAALGGQGVALARSVLLRGHLAAKRLVRVGNVSIPSEFTYHAVYRSDDALSPESRQFLDWLASHARGATPSAREAGGPWRRYQRTGRAQKRKGGAGRVAT